MSYRAIGNMTRNSVYPGRDSTAISKKFALISMDHEAAAASSLVALYASFVMDLPTGAAIVVACGGALVVSTLVANPRHARPA